VQEAIAVYYNVTRECEFWRGIAGAAKESGREGREKQREK
jgi:hypothetical protein